MTRPMTGLATAALIAALALPALAQEAEPPAEDGWSLMQKGAGLLFDGVRSELDPALQDMATTFAGAEPMLRELIGMMGEVTNYHAPEVLPNGDIIIRRKAAAELAEPAPEVEL